MVGAGAAEGAVGARRSTALAGSPALADHCCVLRLLVRPHRRPGGASGPDRCDIPDCGIREGELGQLARTDDPVLRTVLSDRFAGRLARHQLVQHAISVAVQHLQHSALYFIPSYKFP